jgi:hypothetical protein
VAIFTARSERVARFLAGRWRTGELYARLDEFAPHSVRIATLLGSNAPQRALVAELGRIREHKLRESPDLERDAEVPERIYAWFEAASLVRGRLLLGRRGNRALTGVLSGSSAPASQARKGRAASKTYGPRESA